MGHRHDFDESGWPFDVRIDTAVFTTRQVMESGFPILEVHHDAEGDWQFLCGTTSAAEDAKLVCLGCTIGRDPTLAQLADMPVGWAAFRSSPSDPWMRAAPDQREDTVGTWGTGALESDRAADWVMNFESSSPAGQLEILQQTFALAVHGDHLDNDTAADVLAGASILATLVAGGGRRGSEELQGLRAPAIAALQRVAQPQSEWFELWRESGHLDGVVADVDRLAATLASFDDWAPHEVLHDAAAAYLRDPDVAVEALRGVVDIDTVRGFVLERVIRRLDSGVALYQEIALTDGERLIVWMGDDVIADEDADEPGLALFQSQLRVIPLTWVYDVTVEANFRTEGRRRSLHSAEVRVFIGAADYSTSHGSERTDIYNHELRFTKSQNDGGAAQAARLVEFGRLIAKRGR